MRKTPNGFRAVRMRGKTEVVYCVEHKEFTIGKVVVRNVFQVWAEDGMEELHPTSSFNSMFTREYSPMPPAVRARFEGKPSFSEWWEECRK